MQIVGNKKLIKILSKCPRYWQLTPINFNSAKDCIIKRTERYSSDWYFKNGYNTQLLREWKIKVLKLIDKDISFIKTHCNKFKHSNEDSSGKTLENLHKNFFAPIDKANSNIAFFIC